MRADLPEHHPNRLKKTSRTSMETGATFRAKPKFLIDRFFPLPTSWRPRTPSKPPSSHPLDQAKSTTKLVWVHMDGWKPRFMVFYAWSGKHFARCAGQKQNLCHWMVLGQIGSCIRPYYRSHYLIFDYAYLAS